MKARYGLALVVSALLLGCSKDEPTAPQEPDVAPAKTVTIGSAGGILDTDDFSLTVPAGAFAADANLELYEPSTQDPFTENGCTGLYLIKGIPLDVSEPLEIAIKHDGLLSYESMIAVGEAVYVPAADTSLVLYDLLPATDTGGYLVTELAARDGTSARRRANESLAKVDNDPILERYFKGVTRYKPPKKSAGGHFKFTYPHKLQDVVENNLEVDLETAYVTVMNMGIDLSLMSWPVKVIIEPLHEQLRYAFHTASQDEVVIYVNEVKLNDASQHYNEIIVAASREFLHCVLSTVDLTYFIDDGTINSSHYWLHSAVATWSEKKFSSDPDHVPEQLQYEIKYSESGNQHDDSWLAPLNGIQAGAGDYVSSATVHGFGMSSLIEYLVRQYGETYLSGVYGIMIPDPPVPLLLQQTGGSVNEWWPDFITDLVTGKFYSYYPLCEYGDSVEDLRSLGGFYYIESATDTLKVFSETYPDLSAKPHRIHLDYAQIDESAAIRFKVTKSSVKKEDIAIIVFGYGVMRMAAVFEYFTTGTDEVTITDIRSLIDSKYTELIVVVANSNYHEPTYTGSADVDLEVRVMKERQLNYTRCYIGTEVRGEILYSDGSSDWWSRAWRHQMTGKFTGNTFVGEVDETVTHSNGEEVHYDGDMEVVMDPASLRVVSSDLDMVITYSGVEGVSYLFPRKVTVKTTSEGLQLEEHHFGPRKDLTGEDVCEYVTSFEYLLNKLTDGTWNKVVSYKCNQTSRLQIEFSE